MAARKYNPKTTKTYKILKQTVEDLTYGGITKLVYTDIAKKHDISLSRLRVLFPTRTHFIQGLILYVINEFKRTIRKNKKSYKKLLIALNGNALFRRRIKGFLRCIPYQELSDIMTITLITLSEPDPDPHINEVKINFAPYLTETFLLIARTEMAPWRLSYFAEAGKFAYKVVFGATTHFDFNKFKED